MAGLQRWRAEWHAAHKHSPGAELTRLHGVPTQLQALPEELCCVASLETVRLSSNLMQPRLSLNSGLSASTSQVMGLQVDITPKFIF